MVHIAKKIARASVITVLYGTRVVDALPYDSERLGYILLFHRIRANPSDHILAANRRIELSARKFERILDFFSERDYEFISIEELYERLLRRDRRGRAIVVTFDDGFKDVVTLAYPILAEREIPFILYLTTSYPNRTYLHWRLFIDERIKLVQSLRTRVGKTERKYNTATPLEKRLACDALVQELAGQARSAQIQLLCGAFDVTPEELIAHSNQICVTWEEVRKLSMSRLATIGAHTVTHRRLSTLDEKDIANEIGQSVCEIENQTKQKVRHFAYPYGGPTETTSREVKIIQTFPFRTCVTTAYGFVSSEHEHQVCILPRVEIAEHDNPEVLDLKLRSGL